MATDEVKTVQASDDCGEAGHAEGCCGNAQCLQSAIAHGETLLMLDRLTVEADLCANEGAHDIAILLNDAVKFIERQAHLIRADRELRTPTVKESLTVQSDRSPDAGKTIPAGVKDSQNG